MDVQDDKNMAMHNHEDANKLAEPLPDELSDTWRELLGSHRIEEGVSIEQITMPCLPAQDPWSQLIHAQGIELIDLQHLHMHEKQMSLSELEVEQALQFIQEQSREDRNQV